MALIFYDYVRRNHHAALLSRAGLVQLTLILFTILFPLFIAYTGGTFWAKYEYYVEQPQVVYKQQFIVTAQGSTEGAVIGGSSFDQFNLLMLGNFRVPQVSIASEDDDYDDRPESYLFQIDIPLTSSENVQAVSGVILFAVTMSTHARVLFEAAAFFDEATPFVSNRLDIDGDFDLRQMSPWPYTGTRDAYSTSIVNTTTMMSLRDIGMADLAAAYGARNDTMMFRVNHRTWTRGATTGTGAFRVNLRMHIRPQVVQYRPGFLEVVKDAWIKYLSVFWVVWFVVKYAKRFVFVKQIVPTRVVYEKPKLD